MCHATFRGRRGYDPDSTTAPECVSPDRSRARNIARRMRICNDFRLHDFRLQIRPHDQHGDSYRLKQSKQPRATELTDNQPQA
jgi:hypothetical protein